jgi:hypothetical protein
MSSLYAECPCSANAQNLLSKCSEFTQQMLKTFLDTHRTFSFVGRPAGPRASLALWSARKMAEVRRNVCSCGRTVCPPVISREEHIRRHPHMQKESDHEEEVAILVKLWDPQYASIACAALSGEPVDQTAPAYHSQWSRGG